MSDKIDDGGPAFPQNDGAVNRINNEAGMSLRQWYAGQALLGLLMDGTLVASSDASRTEASRHHCAREAFALADAMIAAGKEPRK